MEKVSMKNRHLMNENNKNDTSFHTQILENTEKILVHANFILHEESTYVFMLCTYEYVY